MPGAGRDQLLDLRVGLGAPSAGSSSISTSSGTGSPSAAGQLAGHDLGRQRLRALARAAELEHVEAVVVGLHDRPAASRPRAAGSRSAWRSPCAARLASWLTDDAAGAVDAARRAAASAPRWRATCASAASTTYDELWRWSVDGPRGLLGLDLGSLRRRRARRRRCWRRARCRARSGSRARSVNYAEHAFRGTRRRRAGDRRRRRGPRGRRVDVGRAARADARGSRPGCARWASSAATASSPTCRTSRRPRRRSWPAPRWARSGRAARRTSARAA